MSIPLLIVGTSTSYVTLVRYRLNDVGPIDLQHVGTGAVGLRAVQDDTQLVLVDLHLPEESGLDVVGRLRDRHPELPILLLTKNDERPAASEAFNRGATDVLVRGHSDLARIEEAIQRLRDGDDVAAPAADEEGMIGESDAMDRVFRMMEKAQQGSLSVAVLGESGTGKERVAQALHDHSERADGPFVAVNCAAIPPDLAESTFFGHEKGSFTGADEQRKGHFEQADGGTLFLDEIGEMDLSLQAKLLRTLENREVQRVGSSTTIPFDARILCATNADPQAMIEAGTLREDLYYRLFQFPIRLPPLRDRGQDVLRLARYFLSRTAHESPEAPRSFSTDARRRLLQYDWPGNVRELKTKVERAGLLAESTEITPNDLFPEEVPSPASSSVSPEREQVPSPSSEARSMFDLPTDTMSSPGSSASSDSAVSSVGVVESVDDIMPLDRLKTVAVQQAVRVCEGNVTCAAEALEVSRSTVYRVMKRDTDAD